MFVCAQSGRDLFHLITLSRCVQPDVRERELLYLECRRSAHGNNVHTRYDASAVVVADLHPLVPINWTAAAGNQTAFKSAILKN